MFIQLQKQFRMVETVVVKSLCLDLTEYNINYTKKKSKERIDKKVTGHSRMRFSKNLDSVKHIDDYQKIIRGSFATINRLIYWERLVLIVSLTAHLFVDKYFMHLWNKTFHDDQVLTSLNVSIQINVCPFVCFAIDIVLRTSELNNLWKLVSLNWNKSIQFATNFFICVCIDI